MHMHTERCSIPMRYNAEDTNCKRPLHQIDTALTLAALRMAVKRERPAPGLMFHSDRGVQYAAAAYREKLEKLGFVQSMSRKGEPHDNAVAENFFSCLKCELVYLTSYATRRQAQNSIFRYIEGALIPDLIDKKEYDKIERKRRVRNERTKT